MKHGKLQRAAVRRCQHHGALLAHIALTLVTTNWKWQPLRVRRGWLHAMEVCGEECADLLYVRQVECGIDLDKDVRSRHRWHRTLDIPVFWPLWGPWDLADYSGLLSGDVNIVIGCMHTQHSRLCWWWQPRSDSEGIGINSTIHATHTCFLALTGPLIEVANQTMAGHY